jgi:hypothetical protein
MSRTVAVIWHASFSFAAAVLYFFFVLPRQPELDYTTSHTLGTVLRIVTGALIGLAALPVVFTLLRTRRPELGTPQLALRLRTSSIVLHVLAGVAIIGAAISEIWLSLDDAGQWLFGIYGAAAAIALLGVFTFYLANVAELPPPPPKPLKAKKQRQGRGRRAKAGDDSDAGEDSQTSVSAETADDASPQDATDEVAEQETEDEAAEVTAEAEEAEDTADEPASTTQDEPADTDTNGKLRNRRPTGKTEPGRRRRRRLRGGVAVED